MMTYQSLTMPMPWAASTLINSQYKLYSDLERLIGKQLNEHELTTFRGCTDVNDVFSRILNNRIFARLIVGDQAIGSLYELYTAMQSEGFWSPQVAWDVFGWFGDGHEAPTSFTIQVRHSKKWKGHTWTFPTIDSSGERRYDMLVCVGCPVPEIAPTGAISHDLHPANTEIFLIPVADITSKTIQISRTKLDAYGRGVNKYWNYNIHLHRDIKDAVQRVARGLPVHVISQISMDYGAED
jgi:hypothetical protein